MHHDPRIRVARLVRAIREETDARRREELEAAFQREVDAQDRIDIDLGLELPGERIARSERIVAMFPDPAAAYGSKQICAHAQIATGTFREWRKELGSAIISKNIEGRTLFMLAPSKPPARPRLDQGGNVQGPSRATREAGRAMPGTSPGRHLFPPP
jgi:hypothetical protein